VFESQSGTNLGLLVVESQLTVFGDLLGAVFLECGDLVNAVVVCLRVGELGVELTFRDQIGELTELVEEHIEVGDGVAEVFSLTEPLGDASEDGAARVDDGFSRSSIVARRSGGGLKLSNMFGHHDEVSLLFGGGPVQFRGPLVSDVLHDADSLSDLEVTVDQIGQVGVVKAKSELFGQSRGHGPIHRQPQRQLRNELR